MGTFLIVIILIVVAVWYIHPNPKHLSNRFFGSLKAIVLFPFRVVFFPFRLVFKIIKKIRGTVSDHNETRRINTGQYNEEKLKKKQMKEISELFKS